LAAMRAGSGMTLSETSTSRGLLIPPTFPMAVLLLVCGYSRQ
jgi:hypothetical protein